MHEYRFRTRRRAAGYLSITALLLSVCTATAAATPTVEMDIKSFAFTRADLTVVRGTTVTWINRDESPHTVTGRDRKFSSPALDTDERFSFTFAQIGDYPYHCALHPQMVGVVHVVAAQ